MQTYSHLVCSNGQEESFVQRLLPYGRFTLLATVIKPTPLPKSNPLRRL
jgi:hypothetical protein